MSPKKTNTAVKPSWLHPELESTPAEPAGERTVLIPRRSRFEEIVDRVYPKHIPDAAKPCKDK